MKSRSVDLISLGEQKKSSKKSITVWMMNGSESQTRLVIAFIYVDSRSGTEERALGSARLCNKVKLYTIFYVYKFSLIIYCFLTL